MYRGLRISGYIASVVVATTLIILLAFAVSGSWAVSAGAGVIAGVLSGALYPIFFRARRS